MLATKKHCRKLHNADTINGNYCTDISRKHLSTSELDALEPFCRKCRGIDISIWQFTSY